MVSANINTTLLPETTPALRRARCALQPAQHGLGELDPMVGSRAARSNTLRALDELEPDGASDREPPVSRQLVTVFSDQCAVCGEPGRVPLAVDRCRRTGRVRGLLCRRCHAAVECLDADPLKAERLADYLRQEPREEAH